MKNGPYELVHAPQDYPGKRYRGLYIYEHHLVWWQQTKTLVPIGMILHHKNHKKRDNRFENLELLSNSSHVVEHGKERSERTLIETKCGYCGIVFKRTRRYLNMRLKLRPVLFCSRSCGAKNQHRHTGP